ncbi:FAD-dependent oxidoreductase [Nocardiopsis sp. HNM0947]|uniref:FAD-dependent oxidoreductase n=1 Tax=Nocardiopsis coralli TaxID=2772213 RepID=A0ABR9NZS8_9ACTN|nr:FAD-dependent oxidoreductase [Nocardiopsis coralli]MBE2997098.1 FAD-dependent oxidoreductase [Nocardiopsis coralli]
MSGEPPVDAVPAERLDGADHTCDVLVVGFGCAGASAAFEAASSGASVTVLDRAGGPGGASAVSGGEIYLGGGTPVQRACGFEDTPEEMYTFLEAALGPHPDREKLRLYCEGSPGHHRWLTDRGITFRDSLYDAPTWMPPTGDGLMWLGENAWPYDTLARPAPRGHRPPVPYFGGREIMDRLVEAATGAGAKTHADTGATNLVVDNGGRVVGAVARRYGERLVYRARRAVVLTTGGFVDSEEMLERHAPVLVGHGKVSAGTDDGSGIRMAAALGAGTRRMASVQIALQVLPALIARGMLVDGHGQRFHNEDVYPGLISAAAVRSRPGPYWAIIDEQGFEDIPDEDLWGIRPRFVEETLADLERAVGVPAGALEETVTAYNRHAERGEDPFFHKNPAWLRPLRPPYAAVDPRAGFRPGNRDEAGAGTTGVSGFTLGGLHTGTDGHVLHTSGHPIPGLYAAGRASSGMHGEGYVSGTSLGEGTFFGRRAGRAAAAEKG